MIGYTMVGSNDIARAKAFYDRLLPLLGGSLLHISSETRLFYGAPDSPMFAVTKPYDGKEATIGNGSMVALISKTRALVDEAYAVAMASGGTDEGAPGARDDVFYAGYFRDPDGNKLCVFKLGPDKAA